MQVEQELIEQSLHEIDMNGEKEKIQFALELAIHEVESKKKRGGGDQDDDETNLDETRGSMEQRKAMKKQGILGTNTLIKLPFIIGTKEYEKHPFAGLVYLGGETEQVELFKEEQQQLIEDKKQEEKVLQQNAIDVAQADRVIEQIQAVNVANIPAPPPGDLGNIPPPPGFGAAYVPALVAGGVMAKPQEIVIPIPV